MAFSKELSHFIMAAIFLLALTACSKGFELKNFENMSLPSQQGSDPTPNPPSTPPSEPFAYKPLLWESSRSGSKLWSDFVFQLIKSEAKPLLEARDFDLFCPKYHFLSEEQKVNVAGMLVSAMVKFESGFSPTSRFLESTMGMDSVTGLPVYSEGLMQLSYQDTKGWPFCAFDWNKDKKLSASDPRKTILDPYKNLDCGIRILARQIERKGFIVIDSGAYWSVIKSGSSHEKITEIADLVSRLEFCR